jgi:hypothetical protein
MHFKKLTTLLFILLITGLHAVAQRDSIGLTTIVDKTEKLSANRPFEKVYLHFDKPYYAIGDTLWFKAYLTIGFKHQPSALSHIIYVDVINSQDSIVSSLKLPTLNAVAYGDLTLSASSFKQGNYHIRAYTNWMRNFGPDYFFNKTISIGNAIDNPVRPKISFVKTKKNKEDIISARILYNDLDGKPYIDKKVSWSIQNESETVSKGRGNTDKNGFLTINITGLSSGARLHTVIEPGDRKTVPNTFSLNAVFATTDVQFFPEGGDLISGVRSKIAFKAVNPNGLGINISGVVTDNTGTEVASFTSQHAGMGIFALLPDGDKTYKTTVTFADGSKNTFDLPKVRPNGINLAVNNNDPDNLSIKIATNAEYFKEYRNKGYYIVAQSGGVICYTALAALQSQVYTGTVAKSRFPTGILQVTLFAANGDPLSERVVFIQHNDALNLSLNTSLPSYGTKQKVKMSFSAKNGTLPVEGSFSVAVVDESEVLFDEDAETTILSSLLLTSDLRGYIEKPNYYFKKTDSKTLADLDVLMLTQGYRRFSYTDILADKYPPGKFLPERGITVSGTLRTNAGVPVNKGNVNLRLPDRGISVNGLTNADGQFSFANVSIFDSSKVVLSARNNPRSANLMLMTDASSTQPVTPNGNDPDEISNIDSALSTYLINSKKQSENSHVLKEVVIKASKITAPIHERYTTLNGLSDVADQVITTARLKECSFVLVDCIESLVFGLYHTDNKFYIKRDYDAGNRKAVKFFVNGMDVDDNYLTSINPQDIEAVEVYLKDGPASVMRFYDCNGIVSITSKPHVEETDNGLLLTSQSNEVTITPKGFYKARIFYSPRYDTPQSKIGVTDLRNTIYWNPAIITDKNGSADFDYYTADGKGTYRAIIEGIDNDGNIGRCVFRYIVK